MRLSPTAFRSLVSFASASALALSAAACVVGCSGSDGGGAAADDSVTSESSALSSDESVGSTLHTTAYLNLRTGPSTGHSVILVIPDGAAVTVKNDKPDGGWYEIEYDGHEGWSSGAYLKAPPASSGGTSYGSCKLPSGTAGTCISTSACAAKGGTSDPADLCPGDNDIQCCTVGGSSGGGGSSSDSSAVDRAREWVAVDMPYCGGSNGGEDYICGGTCRRYGKDSTAEWNPYRTDCSGLVSYAWNLPAPGRVTGEFAPYDTAVSYEVDADDLQPGDALNSYPDEHIILFASWSDKAASKANIIEEYNCGHVATAHVLTLEHGAGSSVYIPDWEPHDYRSIRKR
jgi:cell wall-associated NlpC family hydrolase